jgi:hypothetical protein
MKEKKHHYYITQRKRLLKKMRIRTDNAQKVIDRNKTEKETQKLSKQKEFAEVEEKIKQKVIEHFKHEEDQRQALEVEIEKRSNFFK